MLTLADNSRDISSCSSSSREQIVAGKRVFHGEEEEEEIVSETTVELFYTWLSHVAFTCSRALLRKRPRVLPILNLLWFFFLIS